VIVAFPAMPDGYPGTSESTAGRKGRPYPSNGARGDPLSLSVYQGRAAFREGSKCSHANRARNDPSSGISQEHLRTRSRSSRRKRAVWHRAVRVLRSGGSLESVGPRRRPNDSLHGFSARPKRQPLVMGSSMILGPRITSLKGPRGFPGPGDAMVQDGSGKGAGRVGDRVEAGATGGVSIKMSFTVAVPGQRSFVHRKFDDSWTPAQSWGCPAPLQIAVLRPPKERPGVAWNSVQKQ
jgi:hypothetical protein